MLFRRLPLIALLFACTFLHAQDHANLLAHIRGEMDFLAGDALRGRGSATHDEFVAASYVVSQLESFGVDNAHIQEFALKDGTKSYNAIGVLKGADPALAEQVILLTAHLDHLGVRPSLAGEGTATYPGADDDASGTTAVLELARTLGAHRPRRTVVFVCFGSEETGVRGSRYFLDHPEVPLERMVANLEFEMIGQPDPKLQPQQLFLTGWERSDLGPELARHGAPLVADPHPAQHFFERSDNIALAHRGIVAQTVSSYGLGAHYHTPKDDLAHINWEHMAKAIESMLAPVEWLANSDWKPAWNPGGRP